MGTTLYEDRFITCDDDGITVRWYSFPFGSKRIPYRSIRRVEEHAMTAFTGKWRIWGMGISPHWFHLDPARPKKSLAIIVETDDWIRPVLTPDDPHAVLRILRDRVSAEGR